MRLADVLRASRAGGRPWFFDTGPLAGRVRLGLSRLARLPRGGIPGSATAVVSLTFDDALANQMMAAALLDPRGLAATFYVPTGLVGRAGYLGWNDILALAERGHEIGGHTANHVHLPDVGLEQARREIVKDREVLVAHGLEPVSFAYPYGESNAEVEALVREAGYRAARAIGGVVETLPPADAYALRSPHSAQPWTTAEHLAGLVLTAEHEQGWLILPIHAISAAGRSSYTTSPADLEAFLDWLLDRRTQVLPVRDVIARHNR